MTLTVKLYAKGDSDFTHLSTKTTLFPVETAVVKNLRTVHVIEKSDNISPLTIIFFTFMSKHLKVMIL